MPRGRKKRDVLSLDEQLTEVVEQIIVSEETLKKLKIKKREIEQQIEENKKEQLYRSVVKSGKTIDEILEVLKTNDTE